jgi:DNA-binding NarL/FixJ family response regulator
MLARASAAPPDERALPTCPEHPGSLVRRYRSHGPNGPAVYPQCVNAQGRSHLLGWPELALPERTLLPVSTPVTASEHEVLIDAAEGLTVVESASRRCKGAETVKTQRKQVMLKLGARNMTHAVALAIRDGLLPIRDAA